MPCVESFCTHSKNRAMKMPAILLLLNVIKVRAILRWWNKPIKMILSGHLHLIVQKLLSSTHKVTYCRTREITNRKAPPDFFGPNEAQMSPAILQYNRRSGRRRDRHCHRRRDRHCHRRRPWAMRPRGDYPPRTTPRHGEPPSSVLAAAVATVKG